jgi:hypothetical protein
MNLGNEEILTQSQEQGTRNGAGNPPRPHAPAWECSSICSADHSDVNQLFLRRFSLNDTEKKDFDKPPTRREVADKQGSHKDPTA